VDQIYLLPPIIALDLQINMLAAVIVDANVLTYYIVLVSYLYLLAVISSVSSTSSSRS
jgi:hypothetical protein